MLNRNLSLSTGDFGRHAWYEQGPKIKTFNTILCTFGSGVRSHEQNLCGVRIQSMRKSITKRSTFKNCLAKWAQKSVSTFDNNNMHSKEWNKAVFLWTVEFHKTSSILGRRSNGLIYKNLGLKPHILQRTETTRIVEDFKLCNLRIWAFRIIWWTLVAAAILKRVPAQPDMQNSIIS